MPQFTNTLDNLREDLSYQQELLTAAKKNWDQPAVNRALCQIESIRAQINKQQEIMHNG